ncbi:uncharacterized protein NPIL_416971 [Nephila pilipes]|uniref:Uncharacterized protein n=1 Tax=Nephila pilipes TaxID=299642 RepID=A0A8X6UUD9_NEPPI|nr:uncharacterized protein NPIL_416971 [Nephila pilipes]
MALMFVLNVLLLLAAANANEAESQRTEQLESEDNRADTVAYESFGSPVYGPADVATKSGGIPPPGKSGYNQPPPPLPAMPAGYSAYLNNLGYVNPYAFNRFGMLPYAAAAAPYAYGAPYGFGAYGAFPYGALGFGTGMAAGLGLPAGLPYANPLMGRAAYNVFGYPGYAGMGYRFGNVGPAALRGPLPPPFGGPVPGPVPVPGPAPAPVAPAPVPGPLSAVPARAQVAVSGKDGTVRYGYGAGQKIPIY